MKELPTKLRAAVAWLLLAVETAITLPVFAVAWLVSSIGFAAIGGFQFARLENSQDKQSVLTRILGEKGQK